MLHPPHTPGELTLTVLIVEDDTDIRESLVEYLGAHGYEVTEAAHGREALDRLQQCTRKPRLIVLDLMMPVMDGRAFRQTQLSTPDLAEIPVLIISAYREIAELAKELRPIAYLKKPLQLADLLRVVARYCPTS
ncbi:MAG: cheY [Myxococcales bacterium]|nr:cheY [Myxococcales bacterium]